MSTGMVNMANCVTNNKRQLVTAATPVISVTSPSPYRIYSHTHSSPHTSVIFKTQERSKPIEAAFVTTIKFCYGMI